MTPHVKRLLDYLAKYDGEETELVRVSAECIEALDDLAFVASVICERWDAHVPDDCISEEHKNLKRALKRLESLG